jgi:Phage tail assembly chaperone proteins, E, or 41 or 14
MSSNGAPAQREFEVTLPIGYTDPEGTIHRRVVLRKMTGREEAILADRKYQRNGGKLVTELLHSCIVALDDLESNGRGPVAAMYSADRNYLLLKLRSITFGPELEATYTCPGCGESIPAVENLDELPVRLVPEGEEQQEVAIELEDGYVDREGQTHTALTMRLPTGADEEAVAPQMRENASLGKNALLARCVKSLGEVPAHRLDALGPRIMSELTMTDRRLIDRALNDAAPGVDLVRELECPRCAKTFSSSLDLSNFLALA